MNASLIKVLFRQRYGQEKVVVRAPGRINLIGEHTDYNDGLVLPAAIDREVMLLLRPNERREWRLSALDMDSESVIRLDGSQQPKEGWAGYFYGLLSVLIERGYEVEGIDCALGGSIPLGAGLSSSAAICCGFVFALDQLYHWEMSRLEMARIAQAAEHWVGIKCGLMDQYAVLFGQYGQVIQLDCRTNTHRYFPIDTGDYQLVLFNSMVTHSLASTAYNDRRAACEKVLAHIQKQYPEVQSLRDIDLPLIHQFKGSLPAIDLQRVEYVLEENERVRQAAMALSEARLADFGQTLFQSHEGLSKKYEVSCEELDFMVDYVKEQHPHQVLGARMMGGGFGGCTLNLIHSDAVEEVYEGLKKAYQKAFGKIPESHLVKIRDGVSLLD